MNPRIVLTALLLFGAAAGWVYYPPPLASDRHMATLAANQMRDDGSIANKLQTQDRLRRWRDQTIPYGCAILGVGVLLAGMMRSRTPTQSENDHDDR